MNAFAYGASIGLAIEFGLFLFVTYTAIAKKLFGSIDDAPEGCGIPALIFLAAAPFIGWWAYHHFAVVWKP